MDVYMWYVCLYVCYMLLVWGICAYLLAYQDVFKGCILVCARMCGMCLTVFIFDVYIHAWHMH